MGTYTIGEVAERTGFRASALRYYEGIGLVAPSTRTAAGYRVYDDRALARLSFIRRAKQLGCTLDEITDMVAIWDGDRCGPVQQRFHHLITDKITDVGRQIDELTVLAADLRAAAAQLADPPVDGPCGSGCACLTDTPAETRAVPIACSLDAADLPGRVDAWHALLATATGRDRITDGVRITFGRSADVAAMATLVAAEQECCAFYTFAVVVAPDAIALEVHGPDAAGAMIDQLFAEPA